MSISKAQANALADSFLDDIGSGSIDDLQPTETLSQIFQIAGGLAEQAVLNLDRSGSVSSGELSKSLTLSEPKVNGQVVSVDLYMNFYGLFINKGVKGTKKGSGLYAFKNDYPSKDMVEAIAAYIGSGKDRSKNTNVKKTVSRNEIKAGAISELSSAYATARSIKQNGIEKTGFLDAAITTTVNRVRNELGAALKIDITKSLERNGNTNNGNAGK